jgi:phage head maturation protease
MERIDTTEFEAHDRRQQRARARYGFIQEGDTDEQRQQVLCGLGAQYDTPHIHGRKIQMLARGCFGASLASGAVVNLQMDHEGNMIVANTRTGLEIEDCDLGLLFSTRNAPRKERSHRCQNGRCRQSRVCFRLLSSRRRADRGDWRASGSNSREGEP